MYENEKFTKGKYQIGYVFDPCEKSDWLVVTFSAVAGADSPIKHHYSFGKVLSQFDCNKLYIQDSLGEYGCYYLCTGLDFTVSDIVSDLILDIAAKCKVSLDHVITVGSSKGGAASLYFALRLGLGHTITLVPQTKIGKFTRSTHPSMFTLMIGETTDPDQGQQKLDQVMFDVLENRRNTVIHLLTTRGDNQFLTHIVPLVKLLDISDTVHNDIFINNKIINHKDISNYSRQYVIDKVNEIFGGKTVWDGINEPDPPLLFDLDKIVTSTRVVCNGRNIHCYLNVNSDLYDSVMAAQFAFYLRDNKKQLLGKQEYSVKQEAHFTVPEAGTYQVRFFVMYNGEKKVIAAENIEIVD